MKTILLFVAPLVLAVVVFLGYLFFVSRDKGKGALQVTSKPVSVVYLDGKQIGQTPLCKCDPKDMVSAGDYTVKLVPVEAGYDPFEAKVKITKSILTVVDRSFGKVLGASTSSEGSTITLTPLDDSKSIELMVVSFPDKVNVLLDSNPVGTTPLLLKNITESDHEIKLQKTGYIDKTIRIRTVTGYRLEAVAYLGVSDAIVQPTPTAVPTPTSAVTPTPSLGKVTILQTPNGFLNVRSGPSTTAAKITTVTPGESYEVVSEESGWYEIKLTDGTGWISGQYAQKQ